MYFGPLSQSSSDPSSYTGKRYVLGGVDSTMIRLTPIDQASPTGAIKLDYPYTNQSGNYVDVALYTLWNVGYGHAFAAITSRVTTDMFSRLSTLSVQQMITQLWGTNTKNFYLARLEADMSLTYVITSSCLKNIPPGTFIFSMTKIPGSEIAFSLVQASPPQSALMYFTTSPYLVTPSPATPSTAFTRPQSSTVPSKMNVGSPNTRQQIASPPRTVPAQSVRVKPVNAGLTASSNSQTSTSTSPWIIGLVVFVLICIIVGIAFIIYYASKPPPKPTEVELTKASTQTMTQVKPVTPPVTGAPVTSPPVPGASTVTAKVVP